MSTLVETAHVEQQGLALVTEAKALVIRDAQGQQQAGVMLRTVNFFLRQVSALCDPDIHAKHTAWKAALAWKDQLVGHAEEAKALLKKGLADYDDRLDAERRELQRQADAEAEATRQAALAAEEEKRLEAAMDAEASGHEERAAAILTAPVILQPVLTPPVALPTKPKVEGVSFREDWDFDVIDAAAVPREYLSLDHGKIRGVVRALKGATAIPGIRVFAKKVVASK